LKEGLLLESDEQFVEPHLRDQARRRLQSNQIIEQQHGEAEGRGRMKRPPPPNEGLE
jgi:hypothetical protein